MKIQSLLLMNVCISLFLLASVASHAELPEPKEVSICSGESCTPAAQKYSAEQLLNHIEKLLSLNEGEKVSLCSADSQTRNCKSKKVCHFVLGGIIPGNGCSASLTFSEVEKNQQSTQLNMKTHMPLTFIGTPLMCKIAESSIEITSINDISLRLDPHFCSWMLVGAMAAKLEVKVESINLDRGEIAGYWRHSVKGTGNGSGSGYLLMRFPKNIIWNEPQ
ncbi:MAG TPA: hypothetical protein VN030_06105 [Cellvibrio sp.]|nr:hypothetical protein [Cellvibrio sp.]